MASEYIAGDFMAPILSYQKAAVEQNSEPVQITITEVPRETFEDEICPQITVLARHKISEIRINEASILGFYGVSLSQTFLSIINRYIRGKMAGRFYFPKMLKLKEGENDITIKVIDHEGAIWEKSFKVIKKVRHIHAPDERWRVSIHFESYNYDAEVEENRKKSLTQKLIKAFWRQKRFWVVDFENLEQIKKEITLSYYIDTPHLGIRNHHEIIIDVFLLIHIQETSDSINILGSLVDFETGLILATKEVFEEITPQGFSGPNWAEKAKKHMDELCYVLATKFKTAFPLCEGSVLSLFGEELETTICKNDGVKEQMKLIIFDDHNQGDDFIVIGEAKVSEVLETGSLASLLAKLSTGYSDHMIVTDWKVITR